MPSAFDSFQIHLNDREFLSLSRFIYEECGIQISDNKRTMLESRIARRLRQLGLDSFQAYLDYLFNSDGSHEEVVEMINVVTTNKTDFFREPMHFEYLFKAVLPEIIRLKSQNCHKLNVWSAGCSTGEEPYTLAMVLSEIKDRYPQFDFFILATDISTQVLDIARKGIYEMERIVPVPDPLKKKYLLKGKKSSNMFGMIRIIPELRKRIAFRRLNFMQSDFGLREPMDIIFCRNVIIYFDKPTQQKILMRFCEHLAPGGFLFMGHSESLVGLDIPLVQVAPTIYRKSG